MPKHKKKFINKKESVTFHLVHRSQQDPLVADEKAPQHVLVAQSSKKKNKEEEHKYGIFFDDEYDYMQHLKSSSGITVDWEPVTPKPVTKPQTTTTESKLQLPSSVFASEIEESVGMLNKAAPIYGPRLDLDPDVVAAMDEDFDFEDPDNILEDNFIELANQECSEDDKEDEENDDSYESELEDDVPSLNGSNGDFRYDFNEVETKSRFTDYSMSSSVMRRNDQLTLLDDRFEKMFESYDQSEIGGLDCEEIEGALSAQEEVLLRLAQSSAGNKDSNEDTMKEKILQAVDNSSDDDNDLEYIPVQKNHEKWDCESILSTYSNLYNHPAKIEEPKSIKIRISKKTGVPLDVLGGHGGARLTAHTLSMLNGDEKPSGPKSIISKNSELSHRSKNETPEERKLRKKNLKDYRRERRVERKANTEAFKQEKIRQEKVVLNLGNNLQGVKIV